LGVLAWWWRTWWSLAALAGVLGFAWSAGRAELRMKEVLPQALEGQSFAVTGVVASLPQRLQGMGGSEGWRFEYRLAPDAGDQSRPRLPPRVLLSCYGMPMPPMVADTWAVTIKWRRPYGLLNPHGNDSALWMLSQNLPAAGTCSSKGQHRVAAGTGWRVDAWRQSLREAIERHVSDARGAGVLAALSLGDQGMVSAADWALYRDTGVSHLLSVSGMHVTMFAWIAGGLAGWAWRRSAAACLWCPAPRAAMWAGTLAAGAYAVFSGWGVPAQRTFGLLLILSALRQSRVQWPWTMSLMVAAMLVTMADPWAPTQPGFWLSFGAVALLMASGGMTQGDTAASGWWASVMAGLQSQWVITLGLAPLTLLLFQQLSIVGLVANAVAIPLISYAVTPLALLGACWAPLWTFGAWLVGALNQFLEFLQRGSGAVWFLPWAPLWAQVLGLVGGVAAALPWGLALRLGGLALCMPLLWPVVQRPAPGALELRVPDVGQGGAAVLRTHRHTVVFDAGPAWGPASDAADRVLLPLLRGLGDRRIDVLMVSHADQDHAGGTDSLLRGLPVVHRWGAVEGGHGCERGQRWLLDGVAFEVLWPPAGAAVSLKSNAASCVLRVEAQGRRVLLTGDIEAAQEAQLLQMDGPAGLATEVMVVPHHGSRTSSSARFVAATWPAVAVVQAGYLNRFGHPRADVVARYRQVGAEVINTVDCGAWMWRSSDAAGALWEGCERVARRRYWLPEVVRDGEAAPKSAPDAPQP